MYANDGTLPFNPCQACNAKGKYVGFSVIENPCKSCGGLGISSEDETKPGVHARSLLSLCKGYWVHFNNPMFHGQTGLYQVTVKHKKDHPWLADSWRSLQRLATKEGKGTLHPWWYHLIYPHGGVNVYTVEEDTPVLTYEKKLVRMCEGSAQTRAALNKRIERVLARKAPVESLFT